MKDISKFDLWCHRHRYSFFALLIVTLAIASVASLLTFPYDTVTMFKEKIDNLEKENGRTSMLIENLGDRIDKFYSDEERQDAIFEAMLKSVLEMSMDKKNNGRKSCPD